MNCIICNESLAESINNVRHCSWSKNLDSIDHLVMIIDHSEEYICFHHKHNSKLEIKINRSLNTTRLKYVECDFYGPTKNMVLDIDYAISEKEILKYIRDFNKNLIWW